MSAAGPQGAGAGTHYDLLVIGGGSGGIAAARRAASYGAKVAIVEPRPLGGTCVNVGCVPKKVMFHAASIAETLHDARHYGFTVGPTSFNWGKIKASRDAYVRRLNGIYASNLKSSKVEYLVGEATFPPTRSGARESPPEVVVGERRYTARAVLIGTGGQPMMPDVRGAKEFCIDSDGFFALESLPRRAAVVGAGYIAVELAGVLNGLGCDTHLFVRRESVLRQTDPLVQETLMAEMRRAGVCIHTGCTPSAVLRDDASGLLTLCTAPRGEDDGGEQHEGFESVLMAIGRSPNVARLGLEAAGIKQGPRGHILVDEFQQTSRDGVYAVGDVTGKLELTPMAIAAGRRLADRLFNGALPQAKASFDTVPSVYFTHPPVGTVGLTEPQAVKRYGQDNVKVYTSRFVNLFFGPFDTAPADKPKTAVKLVCQGPDEKVVGLHVVGMGADEMLQGFAVAIKMGATKADFDACVAIHPTAAEEVVTLPPWGLSGRLGVSRPPHPCSSL
ncbi:glutathione reductase [Tribonema minus]|uniref:Glutathione reductase n=1 Tax=Tribonema minus TaxID=303371 RepID=A0A835ZGV5_9STRA|nr:glutathione reductase [Tribonema minus]